MFDDSPLLNASEGSRIGQVMNIAVKDEHNNKVSTTLNMKIRNHAETHFAEYKPFIDPEDPDKMMYFKLYIEEDSTAMILYLKLEDSVMESIRASELYTFYAKSGTQPSSVDYDFKTVIKASSYETFGFKVFIREDALKKGDIFVALKPMEGIYIIPVLKARRKKINILQYDTTIPLIHIPNFVTLYTSLKG